MVLSMLSIQTPSNISEPNHSGIWIRPTLSVKKTSPTPILFSAGPNPVLTYHSVMSMTSAGAAALKSRKKNVWGESWNPGLFSCENGV